MKFKTLFQHFASLFFPLAFTVILVTFLLFSLQRSYDEKLLISKETSLVEAMKRIASSELESVISDLLILAENQNLQTLVEKDSAYTRTLLVKDFFSLSRRKGRYDQIRFINSNGDEIIRVNYNDGAPESVDENQRQNKRDRYYFSETMGLKRGKVFLSPLDLNIEHGKIEQPLKPMLRFGTPAFDSGGAPKGVLLLNYLGSRLLSHLEKISFGTPGKILLVNKGGFFIKGPHSSDEWGFMLEGRKKLTFSNIYTPKAWEQILDAEDIHFKNDEGFFSFETLYPPPGGSGDIQVDKKEGRYFWKIGTFVPASVIEKKRETLLFNLILLNIIILITIGILSGLLSINRFKRLKTMQDLEEANRMKDIFIDIMQHDLRNPVALVHALSKQILKKEALRESKDLLTVISKKSDALMEMIDNASQLARLETGRRISLDEENILSYLKSALNDVTAPAHARSISLKFVR